MEKKEISQAIIDTMGWEMLPLAPLGGQSCGIPPRGCRLTSKELGFEISVTGFRSQIKSKEFCMTVFEIFLAEQGY